MKQEARQNGQVAGGSANAGRNQRPAAQSAATPSPWVVRFAPLIPQNTRVLDLACGSGRHSRLLLDLGHHVIAVDRDTSRLGDLAEHPRLEILQCDLESGETPAFLNQRFGAIVVTNYLYRPLLPALRAAVGQEGLLIYETFARGNERFGRPSNPDFLLRRGELLDWLHGELQVLAYEDLIVEHPKPAAVQRICAKRLYTKLQ